MNSSIESLVMLLLFALVGLPLLIGLALVGPRQLTRNAIETITVAWTVVKVTVLAAATLVLI